jgi:hypothetical protein
MPSKMLALIGTIPKLKPEDAQRLAVYIVRGSAVIGQSSVQQDGTFRLSIARHAVTEPSRYGIQAVVAPQGAAEHLEQLPNVQRLPLDRKHLEKAETEFRVSTDKVSLSQEVLKTWWGWCRWYCVNGKVVGPDGCPVPGAQVTVYTVGFGFWGYTKTARATVTADANGNFTACFVWCSCPFCMCWPCWPFWWQCWPWWWELDILRVIEAIERIPPGPGPVERLQRSPALVRPVGRELVRGRGFSTPHNVESNFAPDQARTALIQRKLSDARIRNLFPWWWWCCDDPNVVFSATQGANTIVNEDPATDTRWCLEDGSNVTLVGNQQTISACPPGPKPETGFAFTRVGNITVDHIHGGYADGSPGTDDSDLAFAYSLDIYGEFAPGTPVAYYQVDAGQWAGDPSRGGTAPGSSAPLSVDLYNYVFIYDGLNLVFHGPIKMGPFSQAGLTNLYSTQEARRTAPTGTGLDPFPAVPPQGFVIWAYNGLKVSTGSSALIAGSSVGAVDLTVIGYDASFANVTLTPDDSLTLAIDNIGLNNVTAHVNSLTAYRADHSIAPLTGTGDCPAYDVGPGGYVIVNITVTDANGHLWAYYLDAEYGHGHTGTTNPGVRGYSQNPATFPALPYAAPNTAQKSFEGGTEDITFYPPVDCCYEFRIRAGKRVTNGYVFPTYADYDFQTATLKVSS